VKQAVLKEGVPVDSTDDHGNSLLILACQNNHKKIVKFLVKNGADTRATNHKGHDATHYCLVYKHKELLPYLDVVD